MFISKENAALALETFLLFMASREEGVEEELVRQALQETHWAGRLERICPQIYLDGAHNLPALTRLVEFIQGKIQQGYQVRILLEHLNARIIRGC